MQWYKAVILALGAKARELGVQGLQGHIQSSKLAWATHEILSPKKQQDLGLLLLLMSHYVASLGFNV